MQTRDARHARPQVGTAVAPTTKPVLTHVDIGKRAKLAGTPAVAELISPCVGPARLITLLSSHKDASSSDSFQHEENTLFLPGSEREFGNFCEQRNEINALTQYRGAIK
ncbi:Hypothetical protein HDN1F_31470 [gamma proteobacterium HdN1]|nr:Hypothetical protein HDN1F_31470 [gamma proteobacterium HdN1]